MKIGASVRYGHSQLTQDWELEYLKKEPYLVFLALNDERLLLIKLHPDKMKSRTTPKGSEKVFDYSEGIEPDTHQSLIVPKETEFDVTESHFD